jgi:Flp pilus assembly protein TadD
MGILVSCKGSLTPLVSKYVKTEPQPLELVAGKVPVTINATFPSDWFDSNMSLTVIPILRYEEGEAWGTSYNYQGEKVAGNGQIIPQKTGANVIMKSTFDYTPEMQSSELYLVFQAKKGKKSINLPEVKIGYGVLATAALLSPNAETPAFSIDQFQRMLKEAHRANILFLVQQAELRSSELNKNEVRNWKNKVEQASSDPNKTVEIEVSSYSSPEGGHKLNEKLAEQRGVNTAKYLSQELKKANIETSINTHYTAQDWEGFKELVEKSNIQDKNLILRVLSMYTDSERREREIKNISTVYSVLAEEILPQLRRSRLTAAIEIIGKSDEELSSLALSSPESLSVEELFYAANIISSLQEKETIYKKITVLFPRDARGYNNLGVIAYIKNNIPLAESLFNQANQLAGGLPEANLNLGLIALSQGAKEKAAQFFGKAAGVPELDNAMGYLAVLDGNYAKGEQSFGKTINNNAAIAQILSKNYNKAQNTLNAIKNPNATTYYLKAIVGARTNNLTSIAENLKKSVALDPQMAAQALKDVEFSKFVSNSKFLDAILR